MALMHAQSWSRTEQVAISFFKKQNEKVTATVEQRHALMRTITPVLDCGAGPNLIHLRSVAEPWRPATKPVRSPPLINTSNRSVKALGELTLYVRIGELVASLPLLVFTNHGVDCIVGTTFLDRHVKAILPPHTTKSIRPATSPLILSFDLAVPMIVKTFLRKTCDTALAQNSLEAEIYWSSFNTLSSLGHGKIIPDSRLGKSVPQCIV